MQLYIATILFVLIEQISKTFAQGIPISPCPKMFQYRFDGAEWYGILSVRNADFGQPLHLKVTLSIRGKPTTNYLGEIELLTRGQFQSSTPVLYKVKFPKTIIPPKLLQVTTNRNVVCLGATDHSIFVTQIELEHTRKFTFVTDSDEASIDTSFTLPLPSHQSTESDLPDAALFPSDSAFGTKHLPLANLDKKPMSGLKETCGRIDKRIHFQILQANKKKGGSTIASTKMDIEKLSAGGIGKLFSRTDAVVGANRMPLITSDDVDNADAEVNSMDNVDELPTITRGAWPWLAAIYVNNMTSLKYQCAGTLISTHVVISSAHCFHLFKKRYASNEILVFLGRHNLKNWNEESSLAAPVDDIYIHPEYNSNLNTYDADIAVLVLKNEVRFNAFIRAACLWSGSSVSQYIEGEHGIVVGWGLGGLNITSAGSSASMQSTVPKVINAPIVSNAVCFKENANLQNIASNRTFCAGVVIPKEELKANTERKLKRGPCTGDSGSGLMIYKNNRWTLRGIVAASLPRTRNERSMDLSGCNINQYVLYADVAKFLDWILAFTL